MTKKLLLGYDVGSSSIKSSLINADTGELVVSATYPESEMKIDTKQIGWAEQHPELWWSYIIEATNKMLQQISYEKDEILAIGISYQMHGLVMVDKHHQVIYPAIIWCDSRAVEIGNKAFDDLGADFCLSNYLNSPGNFTASKLKWIKENKPEVYSKIFKIMLPGDYIAMKLTNEITTTISGLSEGILWNFNKQNVSEELLNHFELDRNMLPNLVPNIGFQGSLTVEAAKELGLKPGIPISYRAGDQPNNALSLNVLKPGEIAATAGTSGVIYALADKNVFDQESRVNSFAHVNYSNEHPSIGVLLCINGTGIQYSWLKQSIFENKYSYNELNSLASKIEIGSNGLMCFPFGNGAERVLSNMAIHAQFQGINFNVHNNGHLIRAAQEGIVFAFRYGLDVMKSIGIEFNIVRAGNANLFQSPVFREAFVNTCNVKLELYNTDGSQGAARGAGIGAGIYTWESAFKELKIVRELSPNENSLNAYEFAYHQWKKLLLEKIENHV